MMDLNSCFSFAMRTLDKITFSMEISAVRIMVNLIEYSNNQFVIIINQLAMNMKYYSGHGNEAPFPVYFPVERQNDIQRLQYSLEIISGWISSLNKPSLFYGMSFIASSDSIPSLCTLDEIQFRIIVCSGDVVWMVHRILLLFIK